MFETSKCFPILTFKAYSQQDNWWPRSCMFTRTPTTIPPVSLQSPRVLAQESTAKRSSRSHVWPTITLMAKAATGVLFGGLRGSAGNVVFVQTPEGTAVRVRVVPRDPKSQAQSAARQRMAEAAKAWKAMTLTQAQAWREFAVASGQQPSRANTLFCHLAVRFLAVSPGSPVPTEPPFSGFAGDAVAVTATAISGGIAFTADSPNHPGVVTELLVQPLESVHCRSYESKYRSRVYVSFGSELQHIVATPAGVYACAVRFVKIATGQASGLIECGLAVV